MARMHPKQISDFSNLIELLSIDTVDKLLIDDSSDSNKKKFITFENMSLSFDKNIDGGNANTIFQVLNIDGGGA